MNYADEILGVVEPRLEAIESMRVRENGRWVVGEDYHRAEVANGKEVLKWLKSDFTVWVEPTELDWVIGLFSFEIEKAWDRFGSYTNGTKEAVKDLMRFSHLIGWLESAK